MYAASALVISRDVRWQSAESPETNPGAPENVNGQMMTPMIAPGVAFVPPVV